MFFFFFFLAAVFLRLPASQTAMAVISLWLVYVFVEFQDYLELFYNFVVSTTFLSQYFLSLCYLHHLCHFHVTS